MQPEVMPHFMGNDKSQFFFAQGQVLYQTPVDHDFASTDSKSIDYAPIDHMNFPGPLGRFRADDVDMPDEPVKHELYALILVLHVFVVQQSLHLINRALHAV